MKKFLLTVVAMLSLLVASNGWACTGDPCKLDSNVQDVNDGNKGYLFVYECEKGNNSLGRWVDPKDVPELKGEKGDTGERGLRGERGETGATGQAGRDGIDGVNGQDGRDGADGINGQDGQDGYTPIKGVDYLDGQDGLNGADGYTPIKNVDYFDGKDGATGQQGEAGNKGDVGQDGKTPVKGIDYTDGKDGLNGIDGKTPVKNIDYFDGINGRDGKDVDPKTVNEINNKIDNNSNRIDKLEETQYIVGGELRVYDSKKWQVTTFADYSTNRNTMDRAGVRFQYKIGSSYEERRLDELEKKINKLTQERVENSVEVVPYGHTGLKIKTNF